MTDNSTNNNKKETADLQVKTRSTFIILSHLLIRCSHNKICTCSSQDDLNYIAFLLRRVYAYIYISKEALYLQDAWVYYFCVYEGHIVSTINKKTVL